MSICGTTAADGRRVISGRTFQFGIDYTGRFTVRRIGQNALADLFKKLTMDQVGRHQLEKSGWGHEREYSTKQYEWGDPFNLDIQVGSIGGPSAGLALTLGLLDSLYALARRIRKVDNEAELSDIEDEIDIPLWRIRNAVDQVADAQPHRCIERRDRQLRKELVHVTLRHA